MRRPKNRTRRFMVGHRWVMRETALPPVYLERNDAEHVSFLWREKTFFMGKMFANEEVGEYDK